MLRDAGIIFIASPADIDESAIIKASLHGHFENECVQSTNDDIDYKHKACHDVALKLAQQKALTISKNNPSALVIGSDQILEHDGKIFEKAENEAAAIAKLKTLRGKTHYLISAVCVTRGNDVLWHTHDAATLTMRDFDDAFLDTYIKAAKDDVLSCVGAYALEKAGAWLFEDIKGDYFTILGMPLLPLLGYLNDNHNIVPHYE